MTVRATERAVPVTARLPRADLATAGGAIALIVVACVVGGSLYLAGRPAHIALDRLGLGGGGWAAIVCVAVGALVAVAVLVTLRALGDEAAARVAAPFLVLFPGAVWIGTSADGLFAGVTASGLALLAVGLARRSIVAGLGAGVLLAFGIYLSYGLTLIAVPAVVIVLLARRHGRVIVAAVAGAGAVVVAFTRAGFWWLDGYHLVVIVTTRASRANARTPTPTSRSTPATSSTIGRNSRLSRRRSLRARCRSRRTCGAILS